jgi:glycosyltransferase involved in cell wall biosynthesis
MNFREVRGPYGGANSFLVTLRRGLEERGIKVVTQRWRRFDVALVNALTNDIDLEFVRRLADRGRPLVHRKVGYRVSGSSDMRAVENGVVHGDGLQIAFTPYLAHTVFQSEYSRNVFLSEGFEGPHTVIYNGADTRIYNATGHVQWRRGEPLKLIASSWSPDPNKGYTDYAEVDAALVGRDDVRFAFVGPGRDGFRLTNGTMYPPRARTELAALLREHHVLLHFARYETCSNALIEGLNCGLPAVYVDSGSNRELAADFGVVYDGDIGRSLNELLPRYDEFVARLPTNPFRIDVVVPRYIEVLESVL